MGMLVDLQYQLARRIAPPTLSESVADAFAGRSKLTTLLGPDILAEFRGRVVVDYGCGDGAEAVEIAGAGAARVIGVDVQPGVLAAARERARAAGVADTCVFAEAGTQVAAEPADVIVSLDAFEHFADPAAVLDSMYTQLRPGGAVFASFGPTWYHPLGGHLFSIFPWAHLLLAEAALIRWRNHVRSDGATRFEEVAGGLNRMTIARFEHLVARSPFALEQLTLVPIRPLRRLHHRLTREWTTAVVQARLRKAGQGAARQAAA